MYFNIPEGYVGPWVLAPREFVKNPMTTKLSNIPQKPLTSHDLNDFKKFLHDFKVNEIVFPQSEYYSLEPVISGLGISPVNIEGMMVLSL